ncbi:MAG: hypothetical protein HYU27_02445 [Acidobacteria bacterium]|nr:hypothetical protein [Acidobacteriota bacterium]
MPGPELQRWKPVTLAAFRFCFAYLGLFSLATQISGSLIVIPYVSFRGLGLLWPMRELSIDGQARPADLNDYDRRWRRVIFDSAGRLVFQRTDDSFARYGASIDVFGKSIALTKGDSQNWKSSFTFQRPAQDRLILSGEMDGYPIQMHLQLAGFDTFRLLNSGFRWVRQPDP